MGFNANLGKQEYQERKVLSGRHPAVIETLEIGALIDHDFDSLFDLTVTKKLPAGAILVRSTDDVLLFDTLGDTAGDIVGILVEDADPEVNTLVNVCTHGTVVEGEVYHYATDHVVMGVTSDIRAALRKNGIYLD